MSFSINLSSLNGNNGFRLDGVAAFDNSGLSASTAGDVNGDGFDDVIVGAHRADPNGIQYSGSSYVVQARKPSIPIRNNRLLVIKVMKNSEKLS